MCEPKSLSKPKRFPMSEMRAESVSMVEVQLLRGHVAEAAGASVRLLKTLGQEAGSELQSELLLRLLYVALQALFLVERCGQMRFVTVIHKGPCIHGALSSRHHAGRAKSRSCLTPPWEGRTTSLAAHSSSGESPKCLDTGSAVLCTLLRVSACFRNRQG